MALLSETKSALNVHIPGTLGTFRVSTEDGKSAGVEVKYLLTHVTLSDKQGQSQLLDMLAPVREVFDLKQLGFDEIMQRDIDDSRVSLELIPYLLDSSTSGQIKLFPPIVAVVLPLKPTSRVPDSLYRKVETTRVDSADHKDVQEERVTAGEVGEEQFEFFQFFRNDLPLSSEGARLSLSRDNCALAIVDGQHRAMALLALYRNLKGGWSDAKRSPYESYYTVWPEKEIRSHNLSELQLPMLICAFPQLDRTQEKDLDVVLAARRVFLTLNKTAKKVSDSRNKLLNDQDIVAECLRETLSFIKTLDIKDDTGLRMWNIELDQEGDRVKVGSDVAFSGVSHLYHMTEHLLMSSEPARGVEARGKVGAPRKRLDLAFDRLGLKDELTADKKEVNTRINYSDEVADLFKKKWTARYVPVIERVYGKFHAFAAFSKATIDLHQSLLGSHDRVLEKMLFDGQATARTFDEFRDGLYRRNHDKEVGWTSPEITQTLSRADGLLAKRREMVEGMRANRAKHFLGTLSTSAIKRVTKDGAIISPIREAVDRLFDNVFSTVAFQTALVCTYADAIQVALGGIENSTPPLLDEYLASLNALFAPTSVKDLQRLMQAFEGTLEMEGDSPVKLVTGGPVFKNVVLGGELQPAEWPKYRYLVLELWNSTDEKVRAFVETDRLACRKQVAQSLHDRRVRAYCEEHRISPEDLTKESRDDITAKAKASFEGFLSAVRIRKTTLEKSLFESVAPVREPVDDGEPAAEA